MCCYPCHFLKGANVNMHIDTSPLLKIPPWLCQLFVVYVWNVCRVLSSIIVVLIYSLSHVYEVVIGNLRWITEPENAAVITQCGGIPLIIQCLSSPVRNTVSMISTFKLKVPPFVVQCKIFFLMFSSIMHYYFQI